MDGGGEEGICDVGHQRGVVVTTRICWVGSDCKFYIDMYSLLGECLCSQESYLYWRLWKKFMHLHLQHRQHTSHEEETSNNRRKTKSLHCPQLVHHDADGLADHKTWRTAQTTTPLNILTFYIWDLFLRRILMILQFLFNFITCIRTINQSTDVQHVTSLHQIAYVQRIRCIKK
jgi:hypothetical protein